MDRVWFHRQRPAPLDFGIRKPEFKCLCSLDSVQGMSVAAGKHNIGVACEDGGLHLWDGRPSLVKLSK